MVDAPADRLVVDFCDARERLRAAEHRTRDERAERNDAQRTLGNLLAESMDRNRLDCLSLPAEDDGTARYVRLVRPGPRVPALRNVDDVLALVDDVARHVVEVPREDLPDAIVRLVTTRARERYGVARPPRVQLAAQAPPHRPFRVVTPSDAAPREAAQLSTQFRQAVCECRVTREALKPLRAAKRAAERTLLDAMPEAAEPSKVHMQRTDAPAVVMEVRRALRTPRVTRAYGIREVGRAVREAATRAVAGGREDLDAALRDALETHLGTATTAAPTPYLKVKADKAG